VTRQILALRLAPFGVLLLSAVGWFVWTIRAGSNLDRLMMGTWKCEGSADMEAGSMSRSGVMTIDHKSGSNEYEGISRIAGTVVAKPGHVFEQGATSYPFSTELQIHLAVSGSTVRMDFDRDAAGYFAAGSQNFELSGGTLSSSGEKTAGCPGTFHTVCTKQ
jgi:hypothetical protein